jgi:hypothetical protein
MTWHRLCGIEQADSLALCQVAAIPARCVDEQTHAANSGQTVRERIESATFDSHLCEITMPPQPECDAS